MTTTDTPEKIEDKAKSFISSAALERERGREEGAVLTCKVGKEKNCTKSQSPLSSLSFSDFLLLLLLKEFSEYNETYNK